MSSRENNAKDSFTCDNCKFSVKYDYFGKKPPFSKTTIVLEDAYIMRDPFTDESKCIILGSHCAICNRVLCVSQGCSIFYLKRFCLECVNANKDQFPAEINLELKKTPKE